MYPQASKIIQEEDSSRVRLLVCEGCSQWGQPPKLDAGNNSNSEG